MLASGIALLLVLGVTGGGALVSAKPGTAAVIYMTAPVTKGEIRKVVSTTGTVRPRMTVQVGSELSGRVKSITTDFNSRVKAGDLQKEAHMLFYMGIVYENKSNYKIKNKNKSNTVIIIQSKGS